MKCPHCDQEITGDACPQCGIMVPITANYCMACGCIMHRPVVDIEDDDEFDLENRVLCSDGTCTGIIVEGKCIECGKKYKGN